MSQEYLRWYEQRLTHSDPIQAQLAKESYAGQMQYLEHKHASMEYALKAGLKVVAGTDSFLNGVRFDALADEIFQMVEYGCTTMQAIQSATLWAAESMGWHNIGALEPGRLADVVAVGGIH